jgi:hypothetical protein
MTNSIFEHTSFWTLDAEAQAQVLAYAAHSTPDALSVPVLYRQRKRLAQARADAEALLNQQQAGHEYAQDLAFARYVLACSKRLSDWERQVSALNSAGYIRAMSDFNARRLYWVWGSAQISVVLQYLQQTADTQNASQTLAFLAPISGAISWSLYFLRGALVWAELLSHVLSQSEEAAGLTWQERLQTQWAIHKYALLNDTIWGCCNLLCAVVLYGSGLLGFAGNILTALLLCMDMSLACLATYEQAQDHAENIARYQQDIQQLQDMPGMEMTLARVRQRLERVTLERKHQQYRQYLDLAYSISLLLAFSMLLIPLTAVNLVVVGTIICFTLNVVYSALSYGLAALKLDALGQHHEANEQRALCVTSVVRDLFIPMLFIASLVFLPLSIGIPVLLLGLAAAMAAPSLVRYSFFRPVENPAPLLTNDVTNDVQFEPIPV